MRSKTFSAFAFLSLMGTLAQAQEPLPLDAHVHYSREAGQGFKSKRMGQRDFLDSNLFQRAFLISPTYQYAEAAESSGKRLVPAVHREVSDFIQSQPDRFIGLCGFSFEWDQAKEEIEACLRLPGMKGIKVHCKDSRASVSQAVFYEKLSGTLAAARELRPFVLWHFNSALETEAVFRMAKENPETEFILAHSMNGAETFAQWNRLEAGKKLPNVWVEVSTVYAGKESDIFAGLVPAWRAFGIDRVLFGSDLGFASREEHTKLIQGISGSGALSAEEKKLILEENGRALLRKIDDKRAE